MSTCRSLRNLFLAACLSTTVGQPARAEETTNKTFFLPKSPVAAAYVLGRLSTKELSEAPRGEFVYAALLQRKGLDRKYRAEAVEGLAKLHHSDALTELLNALAVLDNKGESSQDVLRDLSTLVLQSPPADLAAKRAALEKTAAASQLPLTRQIAFAGLILADNGGDRVWKETTANPDQQADLILSLPLIRDAKLRSAFYGKVEPLLHLADPPGLRRAAMSSIPSIPGHDVETFTTLAGLLKSGVERETALAGLQRIPRGLWPKESAQGLVESLVSYLQNIPVEGRTETGPVTAFQMATELTTLLPADRAANFNKTLRALGVSVFVIRTIQEQMLYNKTLIVVEAGKPLTIVLINEDSMPHNLVVVKPGAVEEIGLAAEKMTAEPDAQGRLYTPKSPKILQSMKLVEPGHQARLSFVAPTEPGDYQYVCTFPGHWRRMVGTLAVVTDVDAYLARHAAKAPKMTEWKISDFSEDPAKADSASNIPRGKELFSSLACITCHKLGLEGVDYGPELTDVFQRYQNNATLVLQQILEPSLIISNRYQAFDFELNNGDEVAGMILSESAESLMLQTGPAATLMQSVKKADIKTRKARSSSMMPAGLLNALSKEEISNLLAYLKSGGAIPTHEHQHQP